MNRKLMSVQWALAAFALLGGISETVSAQTVTYAPLFTFNGDGQFSNFGLSVSGAGDVNGDGSADLIVGAPFADSNDLIGNGSAQVFSGADGSELYNFSGDNAFDLLGNSVSGAGDVNGDGFADVIVGAPTEVGDGASSARVLSGFDGSTLLNLSGFGTFGIAVSDVGDVDGDLVPDLIVGNAFDLNNPMGSTQVVSGSDGSVIHDFSGDSVFNFLGCSVSSAGDVNGDLVPDLIVGAIGGRARVFSGSDGSVLHSFRVGSMSGFLETSASGAGDVNGDGVADVIVGASGDAKAQVFSGSDGSVLHDFNGASAGSIFGRSVSGLGDVNGDGFADVIVGAPGDASGTAQIFSGSDGSVLAVVNGDSAGDNFGVSVSGAGDVNGDGVEDFIVGATGGGANGDGYARVFVSQGSTLLGDVNRDGSVNFLDIAPFIAVLTTGDDQVEADINGDGDVDFLDIAPFISLLTS